MRGTPRGSTHSGGLFLVATFRRGTLESVTLLSLDLALYPKGVFAEVRIQNVSFILLY